jgi:hypothetical protein
MARLPHYFTAFQAFVVQESENERLRFDLRVGLEVLRSEAEYRTGNPTRPGVFLYQFEALCRNRLNYDRGLEAIALDPVFDGIWREWIRKVRRQIGMVDIADLIYVHSEHYWQRQSGSAARARGEQAGASSRAGASSPPTTIQQNTPGAEDGPAHHGGPAREDEPTPSDAPVLFGEREGRIALANRRKDPLYLFSSLQRQLGYPEVPRQKPADRQRDLLPQLARRLEQLESRLKILEEEQRGGFDLTRFYERPPTDP